MTSDGEICYFTIGCFPDVRGCDNRRLHMKSPFFLATVAMSIGVFGATVSVVAPQEGAAKSVTVSGNESVTLDAGSTSLLIYTNPH